MNDSAARLLVIVNACITVLLVFAFLPDDMTAFVIIAGWLAAPHLILYGMLWGIRRLKNRRMAALRVFSALASIFGVVIVACLVSQPIDASHAIAIFYIPALQAAAWLLGLMIVVCFPRDSPAQQ